MGRPRRQDFAPADFAARARATALRLFGNCAGVVLSRVPVAARRDQHSEPSCRPLRGFSFCRLRAFGKGIVENAETPTLLADTDGDRRRNFFGAVQPPPMRQGYTPILTCLPAV